MPAYASVEERVWSRICFKDSIDECWLWTAGKTSSKPGLGYGAISDQRVMKLAHRLVYEMVFGPLKDWEDVLHKCDVRLCCNPWHLFTGTIEDNNRDKALKDRSSYGTNHWNNRLSESDVIRILQCKDYGSVRKIANELGIHEAYAYMIRQGKKWYRLWEKYRPEPIRRPGFKPRERFPE